MVVDINGIPSDCSGSCSFTWDSSLTPTLTSVSPTFGGYYTLITLTGTGFSTNMAENVVTVGVAACTVASATDTEITCTVGEGNPGDRPVSVLVTTKGAAEQASPVTFTYSFSVSGISPSSGSAAGGAVVTITGTGFGDDVAVTIGGEDCAVLTVEYTEVTCRAPSDVSRCDR